MKPDLQTVKKAKRSLLKYFMEIFAQSLKLNLEV